MEGVKVLVIYLDRFRDGNTDLKSRNHFEWPAVVVDDEIETAD